MWRDDKHGWHRFRGRGRRGAPKSGANDASSLKLIVDAIEEGRQALAYVRTPEVVEAGRITKQAAYDAAAAPFDLAARGLLELVAELRKGRKPA